MTRVLSGMTILSLALWLGGLSGCAKSGPVVKPETAQSASPMGIVVEQEIGGEILGATLGSPFGLAIDAEGAVYCVDRGNSRIVKFHPDLTPLRDVGGEGSAEGLLSRPGFITIDNQLNVRVSDEGNQRICRFSADLVFVDAVEFYDSDDPLKFGAPSGLAVNAHGEMWVADRQRNRIAVFTSSGQFDRFIGEFGSRGGQVKSPEGIQLDAEGRFRVCDAGNGRIVVYDQYGNDVEAYATEAMAYPMSTVSTDAGMWVIDGGEGHIMFLSNQGDILFQIGPNIPGSDRALREPSDLALLPDNRLLIADTGNNRLLVCRVYTDSE